MTPSQILYKAHNSPQMQSEKQPEHYRCVLCGSPSRIHKKGYIKKTFTNRDLFQCPDSDAICSACAFVLDNQGFRHKMYFCTEDEFTVFKREDLSKHLFNPPQKPFICAIPTSYHKHLWLYCQANYNPSKYMIRFEELNVCLEPEEYEIWQYNIDVMYSIFSKTEIETGDYYPNRIQEFGLSNFKEYEAKISKYRRHKAIFKLLLYAANKREELCPKKKANIKQKQMMRNSNPQLSLF